MPFADVLRLPHIERYDPAPAPTPEAKSAPAPTVEPVQDVGTAMVEGMLTLLPNPELFELRLGHRSITLRGVHGMGVTIPEVVKIITAAIDQARAPLLAALALLQGRLMDQDHDIKRARVRNLELHDELTAMVGQARVEAFAACAKIVDEKQVEWLRCQTHSVAEMAGFNHWAGSVCSAREIALAIRALSAQPANPPVPEPVIKQPPEPKQRCDQCCNWPHCKALISTLLGSEDLCDFDPSRFKRDDPVVTRAFFNLPEVER
jgi:hypothetical protein